MFSENNEQNIRCPSCDKEISVKAKRCPYCREDLRSWFRKHPILSFIGILVLLFIVLNAIPSNTENKTDEIMPTPIAKREFTASVNFDGQKFVVTNLDEFDCLDSRMEVNGGLVKGGYTLEGNLLESGKTYEVGAMQFSKSDGTRLNPFEVKPKTFSISCGQGNELEYTSWVGEFK